jgi:hypothetical protein
MKSLYELPPCLDSEKCALDAGALQHELHEIGILHGILDVNDMQRLFHGLVLPFMQTNMFPRTLVNVAKQRLQEARDSTA